MRSIADSVWSSIVAGNATYSDYDHANQLAGQRISTNTVLSMPYFTVKATSVQTAGISANTWTTISTRIKSGASYSDFLGSSYFNSGTFSDTVAYVKMHTLKWYGQPGITDYDWICVRAYAATEPTTSVGAEQSV